MGDKGGKKDKEKGQKQNASKQKNIVQLVSIAVVALFVRRPIPVATI